MEEKRKNHTKTLEGNENIKGKVNKRKEKQTKQNKSISSGGE